MKKLIVIVVLLSMGLGYAQGPQNIKGSYGYGPPPSGMVIGGVGSRYIDQSANRPTEYICASINPNAPPAVNGEPSCTWMQGAAGPLRSAGAVAWCVNNTRTDTANLQTAITTAESAGNSGFLELQGMCSINGTLITFGAHPGSRYLTILIYGQVTMVNGGFTPSSFTAFVGAGSQPGAGFLDWPTASVVNTDSSVSWSVFDIKGVEGVIIDHLNIQSVGTGATIRIHDYNGNGSVKTTVRYCNILSRYGRSPGVSSSTANPMRVDSSMTSFGLNLIGNVYGVGGSAPLPAAIYLQGIGDVWIASPEGDFNRFSGAAIEINPAPVNIDSINIDVGFSENGQYRDFVTVDPGGTLTNLNIRNTGLSDALTNSYLLLNKGAMIYPVRVTGMQSGITSVLDPASTGRTTFISDDYEDYSMHNNLAALGGAAPLRGRENDIRPRISDLRRNGVPVVVQYPNLVAQKVWDLAGVTSDGGCTVTHNVKDPTGGMNAIGVVCKTSKSFAPILYNTGAPVVGDVFIAGMATQGNNPTGLRSSVGVTFNTTGNISAVGWKMTNGGDQVAGYNGNWAYQYAVQKVASVSGGQFVLQLSASDTQPANYAFPFVIKIPAAAGLSDTEIMEIARTFVPAPPSCAVGQECDINGAITHLAYNTSSAATNTNISATNMVANTSAQHDYLFNWTISLTTQGTSCSGSTTVQLNAIFTDPNANSPTTQSLGTITIAKSGNGTVGFVASGTDNILAKAGTAVQYSTSNYTAGTGCAVTFPTYFVQPTLVQLW